ncbi:hypothetical protein, partial [uncultured Alteromonas sp.]|uniref:hypothetical protein n=1 Tax=uncultured Alteromonas sp. TaxID=179113 RepID=UPI0025E8C39F
VHHLYYQVPVYNQTKIVLVPFTGSTPSLRATADVHHLYYQVSINNQTKLVLIPFTGSTSALKSQQLSDISPGPF